MPVGRQVVRQLDLLRALQSHSRYGISSAELADEYRTTIRTIQRDLNDLREAGFLIRTSKNQDGRSYHYLESDSLSPINFPISEIATLLFMETVAYTLEGTPFRAHLKDLINRIQSQLPDSQIHFLNRAAKAYMPHIRGKRVQNKNTEKVVAQLNQSILEQKTCRIVYKSMNSGLQTYEINPIRFLYYTEVGGFYLIARDDGHKEPITLVVERIEDIIGTDQDFEIRPSFFASIEERLRNSFGIISGKPFTVEVYFSPKQAPYIKERLWHPTQVIKSQKGGGIVISFDAGSAYEIKRWVLQFGADARVVKPKWLREEVIEEFESAMASYRQDR